MTKTEAIKIAKERVAMFRFGDGYKVSVYYPELKAWCEFGPLDYWRARTKASEVKLHIALEQMGRNYEECIDAVNDFNSRGGTWTDYVE